MALACAMTPICVLMPPSDVGSVPAEEKSDSSVWSSGQVPLRAMRRQKRHDRGTPGQLLPCVRDAGRRDGSVESARPDREVGARFDARVVLARRELPRVSTRRRSLGRISSSA
jgi:hypothetical protein